MKIVEIKSPESLDLTNFVTNSLDNSIFQTVDVFDKIIITSHIKGKTETVHVKNTGRCKEILIPGVPCYLEKSQNPNRKTPYDLVAAKKGDRLINIDSQVVNKVFMEFLQEGRLFKDITLIKAIIAYSLTDR